MLFLSNLILFLNQLKIGVDTSSIAQMTRKTAHFNGVDEKLPRRTARPRAQYTSHILAHRLNGKVLLLPSSGFLNFFSSCIFRY